VLERTYTSVRPLPDSLLVMLVLGVAEYVTGQLGTVYTWLQASEESYKLELDGAGV
jgi:hypothetical protein